MCQDHLASPPLCVSCAPDVVIRLVHFDNGLCLIPDFSVPDHLVEEVTDPQAESPCSLTSSQWYKTSWKWPFLPRVSIDPRKNSRPELYLPASHRLFVVRKQWIKPNPQYSKHPVGRGQSGEFIYWQVKIKRHISSILLQWGGASLSGHLATPGVKLGTF